MVSKAALAIKWPVYQPRGWGQPTNSRPLLTPWYGLDTERDSITGDFVCGWAVGETTFSFSRITDLPPATYWVWNLNYDVEGMLRDVGTDEAWAAKSDGSTFPFLGGTACYYHGKRFDWRPSGGGKISLLEAASFFGRQPLSKLGAKEKMDASKMSLTRYSSDVDYRRLVDLYCQQDARIVYDIIVKLNEGLSKLGVYLGATPGATARRFLARLPAFPAVIWKTHKAFLRSYCGGRFEVTKRGVLHNVKQYDLVSAYPWALSNCPWLTDTATHRLTRRYNPSALYGTYQVTFNHDSYLGLAPAWKGGIRVYSKREHGVWLTRPEVEYLLKRDADVTIIQGVEIFDENASTLWRDVITELFAMKQRGKREADGGWGAKIVLNSQYGILIQLVRKNGAWVEAGEAVNPVDFAGTLELEEAPQAFESGKYYAPVYAGHLTALTRVRLLEAAEEVGDIAYVGGHTDSVLTTKTLPDSMLSSDLGGWELKDEALRADVCKTGMYSIGSVVKIRGITREGESKMLWEDTHLRKSRIGIKSAKNWNTVSVIRPKTVVNNFTLENKRHWHGRVTRALLAMEDYIDSSALQLVGAK